MAALSLLSSANELQSFLQDNSSCLITFSAHWYVGLFLASLFSSKKDLIQ